MNQYQYLKVAILRLVGVVDFPVPPNSNMRRTSGATIKNYFAAALTTYSPIVPMARFYGIKFDSSTKVLDFGCGAGTQLMPMTRHFPDAQFFAVDVDPSSIEFVRKNYPKVDAYTSSFMPPLKFADGEMDLVYSASTFSHFDYRLSVPGSRSFFVSPSPEASSCPRWMEAGRWRCTFQK